MIYENLTDIQKIWLNHVMKSEQSSETAKLRAEQTRARVFSRSRF